MDGTKHGLALWQACAPPPCVVRRGDINRDGFRIAWMCAPLADCFLDPPQVAVMLSAQSTDVKVNTVTPELFRRGPDAEAMAKLEVGRALGCCVLGSPRLWGAELW